MASHGTPSSTDASVTPGAYARDGRSAAQTTTRRGVTPRGTPARRVRAPELWRLVWILPLALAAAYLVVFVVRLPHNVVSLTWDSDYASGYTLPETLVKTGTNGNMVMASNGQWVSLWFGLLTAALPLHRQLWGVAPTLLFLASALVVGWSVSQLAGRRTGVLAVLIVVVASPLALVFFMVAYAHNTLYPCTALLGAYLIWLTRIQERRLLVSLAVPPLAGIAAGACLSADTLLAATALIPLGLTAVLTGLRRERRSRLVAASALVTLAVAVPVGKLTTTIMHSLGFITIELPAKVVPLSELPERARLLFKGLKVLFNGYMGSSWPGTLHTELGVASTVVMSAALLTLVVMGAATAIRLVWRGLKSDATETPTQLARSLHVIYWVGSAAGACGVFWIAAETGGGTDLHESYYATTIFAVAAIVPLLLAKRSPLRWLIPLGASVFFLASFVGLMDYHLNKYQWVTRLEPTVAKIARADHVSVGYGGYLVGSSITWNSHGRLQVRPLMECANPEGADLCPFYTMAAQSWYVPAQRHTFLLVGGRETWVRTLPAGLGKPLAVYKVGAMQMYVYPYDIASRLGPKED
jgi:hypothetical protein